ncbi:ipla-1 [Pristionchus pacificus]|nr:ipla-1 [Pristionchus pacificus]
MVPISPSLPSLSPLPSRPSRPLRPLRSPRSPRIVRHLVVQTNIWSASRVTELRCGEVRWFYRRKDLDSKWIPFKGQDSIRLEIRWRQDHGMEIDQNTESYKAHMGEDVVVLDGLYRMNEDHSKITAVYWKEDEAELRRGSWFLPDGQPIQASMADAIEAHHLQYFRGQTIPEGTSMFSDKEASRKPQLTELQLPENIEVKWSSVIDVFLYSTTKASRFLRYVTWGKDTKLRRGFEKEGEWEDGMAEVSHLILVVHGIGQKGYENLIAKNTEQIRDGINLVMDKQYPDEKSRPMLLPVEWRSQLILDDGQTDWITLPKMSSVRNTLNSTAMDIMYYQSPLYRQEIVGGVVKAINSVYSLFKKHNPSYNGPVSIFAHSLGSVISYDIISHWSPLLLYDEYVTNAIKAQLEEQKDSSQNSEAADSMRMLQEVRDKLQREMEGGIRTVLQAREESLQFTVANLFCVGSPLGVFLVMRGAKADTIIPPKETVSC